MDELLCQCCWEYTERHEKTYIEGSAKNEDT